MYRENNCNSKTYSIHGNYGIPLQKLSDCNFGIELDDNSIEFNQSNLTGILEDDLNHLSNILIKYAEKMK